MSELFNSHKSTMKKEIINRMSLNDEWDERAASVSDIRISSVVSMRPEDELKDDEIKNLSEYFKNSRDEIQKKVNSLLNFDFTAHIAKSASSASLKSENGKNVSNNFKPIDFQTATALRQLTVGSKVYTLSKEWTRAKLIFRSGCEDFIYGLCSEKNGTRGLILSVQAVLIKKLILMGYRGIDGQEISDGEWRNKRKILKPNDAEKRDCLISALSEILWTAGESQYASVVLNSGMNCFKIDPETKYFADGLTEKLYIYEFTAFAALEEFMRKNLGSVSIKIFSMQILKAFRSNGSAKKVQQSMVHFVTFQREGGCVLFLYSLILSKKIEKLNEDLQGHLLIGDMEECKFSLFNLVITGTATPFFHNGTIVYDSKGKALEKPLVGIKKRSDIGILYWDSKEEDDQRTEVESMLKTPKFPIWLVLMGKLNAAIIFNTNIDLINNWPTRDTDLIESPHKALRAKYSKFKMFEEEKETEIFEAIKSKWPALIKFIKIIQKYKSGLFFCDILFSAMKKSLVNFKIISADFIFKLLKKILSTFANL
ncbi:hypothetical protein BpHYR1_030217 [Brachionus plicatilis]|uniref:Ubiquitin carboxyl-terminal hydrolase MINDY n=1 Tax=Brachionus plicatilis TaxID=10195 RepID=A0A3M7QPP8_BRAPC|nr:hypothetical protein BpHYR1_030217 [Brachionus plicatilis]